MSASVIASIVLALLAAASLSLSKPSDYHYVAITATNSLDGVGMPGDTLRYEDAAFLAEAYAERVAVFSGDSLGKADGQKSVVGIALEDPDSLATNSWKCFRWGGGATPNTLAVYGRSTAYLDASLTPVGKATVASRVEANKGVSDSQIGFAWCDVFDSDTPFVAMTNDWDASAFDRGKPLSLGQIKHLYSGLGMLTRPAAFDSRVRTAAAEKNAIDLYSHSVIKEYSTDGGTDKVTKDTTNQTSSANLPSVALGITASRIKRQGFRVADGDYESGVTATGLNEHAGYNESSTHYYVNGGDFYVNLAPAFQPPAVAASGSVFGLRDATAVKAFAVCRATYYETDETGRYLVNGARWFVMPLAASFAAGGETPFLLECDIGGEDYAESLLGVVRGLFSDAPTADGGADLLADVPTPDNPSTAAPYDDLQSNGATYRQTTKSRTVYFYVSMQYILVYFDMDFHARVKGDGE